MGSKKEIKNFFKGKNILRQFMLFSALQNKYKVTVTQSNFFNKIWHLKFNNWEGFPLIIEKIAFQEAKFTRIVDLLMMQLTLSQSFLITIIRL